MKCNVDEYTLTQWFLGELSEQEHRNLQKHMETCEICSSRIEELNQLNSAWDQEYWQPSEQLVNQVMESIQTDEAVNVTDISRYRVNGKVLDFIHYITAAAATFLFVYLGSFDQALGIMVGFPERMYEVNDNIQQVTDSGIGWIEGIHYYIEALLQQLKI